MAMALRRLASLSLLLSKASAYRYRMMSSASTAAVHHVDRSNITWTKQLNASLEEVDPEIADIIEHEKARQWKGFELIPSENFTSLSVMQAVGSGMTNKYSEGYPGARYYGGNEYIDMAERLCQKRALEMLYSAAGVVIVSFTRSKHAEVLIAGKGLKFIGFELSIGIDGQLECLDVLDAQSGNDDYICLIAQY